MIVQLEKQVAEMVRNFQEKNYEIYVVGGAVRDLLSNKLVYDWDFTTNAQPEKMLEFLKDAFYDNSYGTVGIPNQIEGERQFEVTTFRTEHGYSDSRRPDEVKWGKTLEEDLQRRDFTINAMALKFPKLKKDKGKFVKIDAELIDKFGGQKDLKHKLIKTVGDPTDRFSEDALRMMRAIRIASELGFDVEEKTFDAIKSNATLINKISRERVRDELFKILKSAHPYEGIVLFKDSGLLEEIIPELSKTFGVEQKSPGRHHIYDVGTHSLLSLKQVAERNSDPVVRLATLIHDIGKPQTLKRLDNGTITFYNHEIISGRIAKRISERLRFSKKDSEKLFKLVRYHQFTVDENQTDSAIRRFIRKVGKENISDMLDLRVGDRLGGGARETSWRLEEFKKRLVEVQKQPFTVQDLKISGYDVMKALKIKSGPQVGEILNSLFDEVIKGEIKNEKKALLKQLKLLNVK